MYVEKDKYYRTVSGKRIGPSKLTPRPSGKLVWSMGTTWLYDDQGRCGSPHERDLDLIAEWTDGPVRTVTRTVPEIVPGNYATVGVTKGPEGTVTVSIPPFHHDAAMLRAAAAVLLELAGALEE